MSKSSAGLGAQLDSMRVIYSHGKENKSVTFFVYEFTLKATDVVGNIVIQEKFASVVCCYFFSGNFFHSCM
jgi:hypothetical protein